MSFTDRDCGITVSHLHTGELVESHYIQYWCPNESGWVENSLCPDHVHKKARTQTTSTEVIELFPPFSQELLDYIHTKMLVSLEEFFLRGF